MVLSFTFCLFCSLTVRFCGWKANPLYSNKILQYFVQLVGITLHNHLQKSLFWFFLSSLVSKRKVVKLIDAPTASLACLWDKPLDLPFFPWPVPYNPRNSVKPLPIAPKFCKIRFIISLPLDLLFTPSGISWSCAKVSFVSFCILAFSWYL